MSIEDYSGMPLIKRPHKDLFISTNFALINDRFWDEYFTGEWEDTNKAWEKYVPPATGNRVSMSWNVLIRGDYGEPDTLQNAYI